MLNKQFLQRVAYFCMEYGLHEEFPIYSGGLGILAGDHIKCAGEKNLPLVGIGILWRQGYVTQLIGQDGRPYEIFKDIDVSNIVKDTGVTVKVKVRDKDVSCKVWLVDKYGNAPLYLLDTNLPENNENRDITKRLYWGNNHDRIAQEIVLGIGGVRALRALGIEVDIYHFNEGHAVLGGIELIREKMEQGLIFEEAWKETRKQVVFTTHTPVSAGNGSYCHGDFGYSGAYNGLNYQQISAIGGDPFNITVAGLKLSKLSNGVSKSHSKTARNMWKHVKYASKIIDITNGVHRKTWQDPRVREAFDKGEDLWAPHMDAKKELFDEIYKRNKFRLNPDGLTIGFARRVTAYKRCDLILGNTEILIPYLENGTVQLIFSGKVHPQDEEGKCMLPKIIEMSKKYPESIVFLENYDMKLGKLLTRGCDVWLNTPRRPLEASGTSGMKAAINGVLNFSILDGWWPEACKHGVNGWQIGHGYEGCNQDWHDLNCLYHTLLNDIIPAYYHNRPHWLKMMNNSIAASQWEFSADRMLNEYYSKMYLDKEVLREIAAAQSELLCSLKFDSKYMEY
ncbi:MAG: alpha-glucan family phosphorylase [Firmicutes bacterium HGW-Firmicutes-13]|nr:MAG: alpha-glucan family phosphorylase [Firmicutes bacterium HGW-Firmicutes-13]